MGSIFADNPPLTMNRPHSSYNQLRELEQRRYMRNRTGAALPAKVHQHRYPANTLGPNEDIVQRRQDTYRKKVTIEKMGTQSRNILLENLVILLFLIVSIWGLYSLTIHLLTHS